MKKGLMILAASLLVSPAYATEAKIDPVAVPTPKSNIDTAERSKIEVVVRELLDREPELVMKAAQKFQEQAQQAQQKQAQASIKDNADALYKNKDDAVAGNPKGDITVVEFFDYSCGYCKRVHPTTVQLREQDKGIRYVYKQYPILGPGSLLASQAAVAAQLQGKFDPMHEALITNKEPLTEAKLDTIAAGIKGLDVAKLKSDMKGVEVARRINASLDLGRKVGVNGTPGFIIKDTLYPGAMELDGFKQIVATARKG